MVYVCIQLNTCILGVEKEENEKTHEFEFMCLNNTREDIMYTMSHKCKDLLLPQIHNMKTKPVHDYFMHITFNTFFS